MWGRFFGYGFTTPVDDMGPHNPASHPELLAELARAVSRERVRHEAAHAVDRAERGVRAEQPGGRRATRPTIRPRASRRGSAGFTCGRWRRSSCTSRCWRRREADAGLKGFDREAMKVRWLEQMNTAAGQRRGGRVDDVQRVDPAGADDDERRAGAAGVPDGRGRVFGPRGERCGAERSGEDSVPVSGGAGAACRARTRRSVCNELLAARGGDVVETLQDVWWAVLNSGEFILVH